MKLLFKILFTGIVFLLLISINSCKENSEAVVAEADLEEPAETKILPKRKLSAEFKSYWYAGEAEITSYKLEQARYGELRDGHAVLIYVTEPFLPGVQVKADRNNPDNVSVMKLNSTKKYLTGIYPYSIMSSTFYPVHDQRHAIKISATVQEWCGHVYSQLNNRESYEVESHSYFEGEADQELAIPKDWLENEIWTKIRINPQNLPLGNIKMIPAFEFIRTGHKDFKAYKVSASLTEKDGISSYSLEYPDLQRILRIDFRSTFPHSIEGWSETFSSGYGENAKTLTSKATKMKELKTPYWRQNGIEDEALRENLGLK